MKKRIELAEKVPLFVSKDYEEDYHDEQQYDSNKRQHNKKQMMIRFSFRLLRRCYCRLIWMVIALTMTVLFSLSISGTQRMHISKKDKKSNNVRTFQRIFENVDFSKETIMYPNVLIVGESDGVASLSLYTKRYFSNVCSPKISNHDHGDDYDMKKIPAAHFIYDLDLMIQQDNNATYEDHIQTNDLQLYGHCQNTNISNNNDNNNNGKNETNTTSRIRIDATWADINYPFTARKVYDFIGKDRPVHIFIVLSDQAIDQIRRQRQGPTASKNNDNTFIMNDDDDNKNNPISSYHGSCITNMPSNGSSDYLYGVVSDDSNYCQQLGNYWETLFPNNQVSYVSCQSIQSNITAFQQRWQHMLGLQKKHVVDVTLEPPIVLEYDSSQHLDRTTSIWSGIYSNGTEEVDSQRCVPFITHQIHGDIVTGIGNNTTSVSEFVMLSKADSLMVDPTIINPIESSRTGYYHVFVNDQETYSLNLEFRKNTQGSFNIHGNGIVRDSRKKVVVIGILNSDDNVVIKVEGI